MARRPVLHPEARAWLEDHGVDVSLISEVRASADGRTVTVLAPHVGPLVVVDADGEAALVDEDDPRYVATVNEHVIHDPERPYPAKRGGGAR